MAVTNYYCYTNTYCCSAAPCWLLHLLLLQTYTYCLRPSQLVPPCCLSVPCIGRTHCCGSSCTVDAVTEHASTGRCTTSSSASMKAPLLLAVCGYIAEDTVLVKVMSSCLPSGKSCHSCATLGTPCSSEPQSCKPGRRRCSWPASLWT